MAFNSGKEAFSPATLSTDEENYVSEKNYLEQLASPSDNLVYDNVEEEPELTARTWIALGAMFLLNLVQVLALQGPPAVLSFIGSDFANSPALTWVPNSLSLVQAVLSPLLCSISDTFQVRKSLLVGTSIISFIGAAIAPGSHSIYRLIVAQILIGIGFASTPLALTVPSEITPRKWRPLVQAFINIAAAIGATVGPLMIGALTRHNPGQGWRRFYWFQMALWGATTICIFFGYRPPKRHTSLDHLPFWQKVRHLDLAGFALLTVGLTFFLTGLNLGGGLYTWTNVRPLTTLILGLIILFAFCVYEWKGTKTGILHHDLFRGGKEYGRTYAICLGLIFIEAFMLFAGVVFYPIMTENLFEKDPFLVVAREMPVWVCALSTTGLWGLWSVKTKKFREPLFFGFLIFTAGIVGLATIQPQDSTRAIVFYGLTGIGFACPLILIIAAIQLCSPHHHVATATAVITSARSMGATISTAIYAATLNTGLDSKVPTYTAEAALRAGLPATSIEGFIEALVSGNIASLAKIPGVTPTIIGLSVVALKQAFADSVRVVYIIAAPFGALACIACFFLGDQKNKMDYRVEAPVEDLHAKQHHGNDAEAASEVRK
ncbi:hypothetical protein MMC13_004398 [Lambiella insularis]|nr:hypothetical protein [Lambiella insularis]